MADPCMTRSVSDIGDMVAVLADPAASDWLKRALMSAVERDPFDAERDALFLSALLTRRVDALVARHYPTPH